MEEETCSVIGGMFALIMQAGLAFITFMVLVWKKLAEHGERTWFEFLLDSSKQLLGAGWMHVANMLCAIIFASELPGVDGCTWYASNILLDTTVGVLVEWGMLQGLTMMLQMSENAALIESLETGSYWSGVGPDRQFQVMNYGCQLAMWLAIVTVMKLSMVALMQTLPFIVLSINAMLSGLDRDRRIKLLVVMIVIPMMMNTFQFVITDNFIKKKPGKLRFGVDHDHAWQTRSVSVHDDEEVARQASGCLMCGGSSSRFCGPPSRNNGAGYDVPYAQFEEYPPRGNK